MWIVFFFKQKTAYDMRISDCSSDVCSSDLSLAIALHALVAQRLLAAFELLEQRRSHRQCEGDGEHVDDREMRESGRHRRVDIDRKRVGQGRSVAVGVDMGGGLIIKKKRSTIL